jgi:metallo-beta-lactamase family protein
MTTPVVTIHGAGRTVTGSCFEVGAAGRRLLVDCGLFQGSRTLESLNREKLPYDPAHIEAVLLTHAHLDHSGLLPRLVAEGFRGPIWCTRPTADLLSEMLPDAARIQEQETDRRNRRADRAGEETFRPLYTATDAEQVVAQTRPLELEEWFEPAPSTRARFWNAGHILGSASVEIEAEDVRLLFSGDLGPQHKSFHDNPTGPVGVDHLFCESTYGDRERLVTTIEQRRAMLEAEVKAALARGGNLIIPAFALERTQELLLDLAQLINIGRLPYARVFIDSPLATRTTAVFHRYREVLEDLGSGEVFHHPSFHYVETVEASRRLNHLSGAIILSASGMCEAGRVRHHLLHNLPRRDSTLLFVGFQAQGTLGRAILDGAGRVRISGRDVAVRAQVRRLDSYSAHADKSELIAWVKARSPVCGSLFLTHGEVGSIEALRKSLQSEVASVVVPEIGEAYALRRGTPAKRMKTGRTDLEEAIGRDWQNDYADLAANLKPALKRIDAAQRKEALARMRAVLESYAAHKSRRNGAGRKHSAAR